MSAARATAAVVWMMWHAGMRPARRGRMPRQQYPHLLEVEYGKLLRARVGAVRAAVDAIMPTLAHGQVGDATRALEELRQRFAGGVASMAPRLAQLAAQVADQQARQLDAQTRAVIGVPASHLGVEQHATVPHIRTDAADEPLEVGWTRATRADAREPAPLDARITGFVHENVSLIKSLGDKPLAEVEQLVTRAHAAGNRHETLARDIAGRFGVAEDRAKLIARDQIGKLNGRISADRHQRMGLTRFIWRDVGDRRVRPAHRHLNGTSCTYANPPSEGLPGEPICCRCHDEPVFDDILAELDALERADAPPIPVAQAAPAPARAPLAAPPDLTPRLAEPPPGFAAPAGSKVVQGLPPRAALRVRETYVLSPDEIRGRLIALPGGGKDKVRLANVEAAQARGKLAPVKLLMLPDGRLYVDDGRHRLLNALANNRPVLAQIGKASVNAGVGTVPLAPLAPTIGSSIPRHRYRTVR